eukprot:SAG31_NODE_1888_length_6987_cov_1.481852_6_plen_366_part_00
MSRAVLLGGRGGLFGNAAGIPGSARRATWPATHYVQSPCGARHFAAAGRGRGKVALDERFAAPTLRPATQSKQGQTNGSGSRAAADQQRAEPRKSQRRGPRPAGSQRGAGNQKAGAQRGARPAWARDAETEEGDDAKAESLEVKPDALKSIRELMWGDQQRSSVSRTPKTSAERKKRAKRVQEITAAFDTAVQQRGDGSSHSSWSPTQALHDQYIALRGPEGAQTRPAMTFTEYAKKVGASMPASQQDAGGEPPVMIGSLADLRTAKFRVSIEGGGGKSTAPAALPRGLVLLPPSTLDRRSEASGAQGIPAGQKIDVSTPVTRGTAYSGLAAAAALLQQNSSMVGECCCSIGDDSLLLRLLCCAI